MIYAIKVIVAPRYPYKLVACYGFNDMSDTTPAFVDHIIEEKNDMDWDSWEYLQQYIETAALKDVTAILVDLYEMEVSDFFADKNIIIVEKDHPFFEALKPLTDQLMRNRINARIPSMVAQFNAKPDSVKIPAATFKTVEELHHITIPADIKHFYERIGTPTDDFHYIMDELTEPGSEPELIVQIDEAFARSIINIYNHLPAEEKSLYSIKELLTKATSEYDCLTDTFRHPLIEKARAGEFNVVLFLWAHCGGWGGLVIKGELASAGTGAEHGDDLYEIVHEGITYTYRGKGKQDHYEHYLFELLT